MSSRFRICIYFILLLVIGKIAYAQPSISSENKSNNKITFLALADLHFDPFTTCNFVAPCPMIKLLKNAPTSQWNEILAKYDTKPPQFRENTNYSLLTSTLDATKKAVISTHAQFVLLLGDSLGHKYYKKYKKYTGDSSLGGYQSFARKSLEFLRDQFAAAFPETDVYFVVGNNDSYQGDYFTYPNGQFFNDTAKFWSVLIKNSVNRDAMQKQFSHAGYYSIILPNSENIRLIVLNSVVFSYKAKGSNADKIALQELNWLHNQLEAAKKNHQKVFIAMHIPEGVDIYATMRTRLMRLFTLWKPTYIQKFQTEITQYASEIGGIFAGHLHADAFRLMTVGDANEIPVVNITSISPIYGNNPGFKICTYSTDPLHLESYINYSYPLNGSRTWNPDTKFSVASLQVTSNNSF